jgi:hypothetical protein
MLIPSIEVNAKLRYACERAAKRNAWTNAQMIKLTHELYRALCCKAFCFDDLSVSVPFKVDACWHELILNTDDYALVCKSIGRTLKHTTRSEGDSAAVKRDRINTLAVIYQQVYKFEPDAWCWELETDEAEEKPASRKRKAKPVLKWTHYKISCKTLTGTTIDFNVTSAMSILTIKMLIQHMDGIPVDHQRLIYAGQQLDEKDTLLQHNITNEGVIHVVLRLGGC